MINLTLEGIKNLIPNYVINVAEELQKNKFEAYLVGGSLRDILIGKTPSDFDIATNAYPEDIKKIFPKSVAVGEQFGTIIVVCEDEFGEKFDVEVTTYRSEADYVGGRWPTKVEFSKTIDDDLSRRDFTVNAIALDLQNFDVKSKPLKEMLVDPFNGIKDLEEKTIRAVRDPIERFSEDGLRSVRACRLASQLGFTIDAKTFAAIKETLHITKLISVERFRDEFLKILLKSPKPSVGIMLLKDSGILEMFIPELLEGINVTQPEFHVDDVFTHLLKCVDEAEDSIKVAALFHDIGKPRTMTKDSKGTHFYGHDMVGAEMTKQILQRLRFSNAEIDKITTLIRWHMFYYPSADWRKEKNIPDIDTEDDKDNHGWSDSAIRRLIQSVGGVDAIEDLMKLRIADASSNPKSDFNPLEIDVLSKRISDVISKDMALKVTDLDITGSDLMENFGLPVGKKVGEVLDYLLDKVIEDPLYNKKLDLLRLAKEYIQSK